MKRDWKTDPPLDLEDGFLLAEEIMNNACDDAFRRLGIRPHTERTATGVVVVWPDGVITNECEVTWIGKDAVQ